MMKDAVRVCFHNSYFTLHPSSQEPAGISDEQAFFHTPVAADGSRRILFPDEDSADCRRRLHPVGDSRTVCNSRATSSPGPAR